MGTVVVLTADSVNASLADISATLADKADSATVTASLADKADDSSVVHKGELLVNVKDFGVLGDGVTDDTTAINAAIAGSAVGSIIYFPLGNYLVSGTIALLHGRTYQGAGRESSIIQAAAASNLDAVMASETWLSTTSTGSDDPINLYDLKIDGNSTNQTSGDGHGLVLITYWNTVENLEITDNLGNGLFLTSQRKDGTEISNTAVECKILRCAIRNSGNVGIMIDDPTSASQSVTDGWIMDCIVDTTTNHGIMVETAAGWLLQGNHLYGVAMSAIYLNRGGYTRIIGNYIETFGFSTTAGHYTGIMCGGDSESWIGATGPMVIANNVMFYGDGADAGSLIRGIRLEASAGVVGHVIITNNGLNGATHSAGSNGIRLSTQDATGTLIVQASGNLIFGWDAQFTYAAGGGIISVTGDISQPGMPTTATDGFIRFPTCAGAPTGVPADVTMGLPVVYDTTNHKLWFYNGAWVSEFASPTITGTATISGREVVTPVALSVSSGHVATDASLSNHFKVAATAAFTLDNPTNPVNGQRIIWEITQDATGSRVMTLGTAFAFGTDITTAVLTTTANKTDYLTAEYNTTANKWRIVNYVRGYA